ncbi:MAG: tRNA (N(6)-L-threonylcarbamoyladenosine(37)-C(2))-methylthiotransferase MtaB, partial [Bacillota bacterium]
GCKVNQYESDRLVQALEKRGFKVFSDLTYADIFIINTCAVTAEAERKSRQAIKRCLAKNPDGKVYICGCSSQNNPLQFQKQGVSFVCGVNKDEIINRIDADFLFNGYENSILTLTKTRARSYVKIQDGCDNFCSYCIIPYLRGSSKSRDTDEIVEEVKALSQKTKEIVLVGINLSLYGKDTGSSLVSLVKKLKDIDVRIRLGSFYAESINKELLDSLFELKHFCPHFHLSLQSGDDEVLKAMNRRYTTKLYKEKIELIRSYDKNACITTDIIVGFPTETDKMFENSVNFAKNMEFSDIHIFPYSQRSGVASSKLTPPDKLVLKERIKKMTEIKRQLIKNYLFANINIEQNVFFEESIDGIKRGYSERYIRVYAKTKKEFAKVMPKEIYKDGLKGEVKDE